MITLSGFDNGISDGLANQIYTPDEINDDPALTLFLNGQAVATGVLKKLSLQTTPQLVVTSPSTAPSEMQLTAAAGTDPTIYTELLMATGGTGVLPFTLSAFALQGNWSGIADGRIFSSTGTTTLAPFTVDYGDLPDPAFRTLLARDGARHRLAGSLKLGSTVSAEVDGQPAAAANLDSDDGVTLPVLNPGTNAVVTVTVSGGSGFLDGWIDFNRDGDFDDAGEHVMDDHSVTTGVNSLSISIPLNASLGGTFARFRLSSTPVESPRGLAIDGEVEDYAATIALATPTITAPSATTTGQRPEFTWSAVPAATSYTISISNLSTGINRYHTANIADTTYIPTTDLGIGRFAMWIQAQNAVGKSAWTAQYNFTINTNAAFNPVASQINNARPTLTWVAIPGAVRYEILISGSLAGSVTELRHPNVIGTSFTPASNLPPESYNAWVRGITADGTAAGWSSKVTFEIISPPATINGPRATTVAQRPKITWTAVPGAASYEIWLSGVGSATAAPLIATSSTNSFTPSADLGIGVFDVWVRAVTASNRKWAWSTRYRFQINTPVKVVQPAAITGSGRPTLYFDALPGAVRYDVWVSYTTTGQSATIRDPNVTQTQWTPESELPISSCRFWVRGINASGQFGQWSSLVSFRVATAPTPIGPSTSTFDRTPTFTWGAVTGAATYTFQLRNMTTGITINTVQNLGTPTWTAPTSLPIADYRWWSVAIGVDGWAANWSVPTDFSVGGATRFTTPSGTLSTTPTFTWLAVDEAARYEILINRTDVAQFNVLRETHITSTSFTVSTPLVAGGSYRTWNRAISTSGEFGPWSALLNFSVMST